LSGVPAEAERRYVVVSDQRREEGDGYEGQAEVFGYGAAHVGFVDQHGVEVGVVYGCRSIAKDHTGGVFDAIDGEAKGCETVQFAQAAVQLLKRSYGVVLGADPLKIDTGCFDAGFGVGDAEDHYLVASVLQTSSERRHWIDVSGSRETKCSKSRHGSRPVE
jgi:hypothetical protein